MNTTIVAYTYELNTALTGTLYLQSSGASQSIAVTQSPAASRRYIVDFSSVAVPGIYDLIIFDGSMPIGGDTYAWDGTTVTRDGLLLEIETKIDALAAVATVAVISPVVDSDTISLIRGDDYLDVDGRSLQWPVDGQDLTDATVILRFTNSFDTCDKHSIAGTIIAATDGYTLSFDVSREVTSKLAVGEVAYTFAIVATLADASIATLVTGKVGVT